MTIQEVVRIYEEKIKGTFFSKDNMRFFRQTMKSFSVVGIGGNKYVLSAPMKDFTGKKVGMTVRIFDAETGELTIPEGN